MTIALPAEIFKAYDIRGIVGKTLTPEICRAVGQALGLGRENVLHIGPDAGELGPSDLFGAVLRVVGDDLALNPDPCVEPGS